MILNMTGGGGAGLNFKVVGGTTQPASPAENTIWVNTDTAITDWVFSATQPAASAGRVWLNIGTASDVAFNALKKNGLWAYPVGCAQYINSAWVAKIAKTYQGGAWKDWTLRLYWLGDQCDGNTGGWTIRKEKSGGSLVFGANEFTLTGFDYNAVNAITVNSIDLTRITRLEVFVYGDNPSQSEKRLGVTQTSSGFVGSWKAYVDIAATALTKYTLDVSSLTGSYYVGFQISRTSGTGNVSLIVSRIEGFY